MAQGIQIGDAVLKMFVDWTEIDQIGANLPAHLKPGTDAAASLGQRFDSVGKSAGVAGTQAAAAGDKIALAGKAGADAFKGADTATQALVARIKTLEGESKTLEAQIAQLQARIAQLGPTAEPSIRRVGTAFHEAQGEAALLGELTGVRLPRHVRSFVASLPGVGTALTAAFEATAILFIIEAVVQLGEKVQEFIEKPEKIAEAWKNVSDSTVSASRDMTKALDESAAKVIGLAEGPLAALDFTIKNIGTDSTAAAAAVGKIGEAVTAALDLQQANAFAVAFFGAFKDTSRDVADDSKKFFGDIGPEIVLSVGGALDTVNKKLGDLRIQIDETKSSLNNDPSVTGQYFYKDRLDALERYRTSLLATQKVLQDGVDRGVFEKEAQVAQRAETADNERATAAVQNAKNVLDARIASIETVKAQQQAAFDNGTATAAQWSAAQIKAANDSADAQVRYKQAIAASAFESLKSAQAEAAHAQQVLASATNDANRFALTSANEKVAEAAAKARGAAEDAANERINENNKLLESAASKTKAALDEAKKIRAEWEKQTFGAAKAEDAAHALDELTRAELKLAEAQKNLKEIQIASEFSAQEAQIKRLADFSVISEEEKEARLKTLYERERQDALKALTDLQSQELATLNAAKAKFEAASSDPFFSDAQLADLKRKLDEAQVAYDNTQGQIIKVTDQFKGKLESLTLAERQAIASELALAKAKQAQLQEQRAVIAANGGETSSVDKQIAATKSYESELTRLLTRMTAVTKTKPTWDSFFTDLITRSLSAGHALQQMGQLFSDAIGQSVEAAVNGQETFGEAMLQFVKSTLASLAGAAVGHVLTEIAKASSDFATAATLAADPFTAALAPGFIASAHAHLVAAAEWGAIGAGAAIGGAAIPGGGSSSSSANGGNNVSPSSIGENGQASQQPVFIQNVQHMSGGGVAEKRKLVVVGDAPGGGDAAEGIIPLNDERAKQRIANALLGNMIAAFSGFTTEKARTILPRESVAEIVRPQPFSRATLQVAREASQVSREAEASRASAHAAAPSGPPVVNHYETHEHNWHIEGVISEDNLSKVMKRMSDKVKNGSARFHSSTSFRVNKRG